MILNPHIFREYDIRGVAERDLSDAVAVAIGQGFGTWLRRQGADSLAVGRDCRLHSPRLHQALCQGLLQSGMNVLDVGIVPSPLLYFAVHHLQAGGGAQITGSHNPPSDNGFKLLHGKQNLHGPALQELHALIERRDFLHGHGQLEELDIHAAYATFVTERLQLGRVVVQRHDAVVVVAEVVGVLVVGGTERKGSPALGMDLGALAGTDPFGIVVNDDPSGLFETADVVIDFTNPSATALHAGYAARGGTAHVIGTTGLDSDQQAAVARAAQKAPIVMAANMSLGVNLLEQVIEQMARILDSDWDIEIVRSIQQ